MDDPLHESPRVFYLHPFLDWLQRLPIPTWLTYSLVTLAAGLIQHIVAARAGYIQMFSFHRTVDLAGIFLVSFFIVAEIMVTQSTRAIDKFRPLLDGSDEEIERIKRDFIYISMKRGMLWLLIGSATGLWLGIQDMAQAAPEMYAFPIFRLGIWALGTGVAVVIIAHTVTQVVQMRKLYARAKNIDLFHLSPIYAMSRYFAMMGIIVFIVEAGTGFLANPEGMSAESFLAFNLTWYIYAPLLFIYPIIGVNQRLAEHKQAQVEDISTQINLMQDRLFRAAIDDEDYANVSAINTVLNNLRAKEAQLEGARTWPWRPGTLTGLLSTLFLPLIIGYLRDLIGNYLILP